MNNTLSPMESLRDSVSRLNTLPAIPKIAQEILALKLVTDEGERALLKLIERDPLLSAKIIGLANAPVFGASKTIMSVKDAAIILGIKRVKMISLSFAMMSAMVGRQTGLLNIQNLWQHSLAVVLTMQTLSRSMPRDNRPEDEEIFLAGLLHDIGFLLLNHINPKLSDKFHLRLSTESKRPVEEIENEMLEMSHSELGAELAIHWNLPEAIVSVLRYHHLPDQVEGSQTLVRLVNLAEKLLPTLGIIENTQQVVNIEEWQALGVDPAKADEIIEIVHNHNLEVESMFC